MKTPAHGTEAGLCASCVHARTIQNEKGSTFILCEMSKSDPRFPKYPRLPVLACPGYREANKKHGEKT